MQVPPAKHYQENHIHTVTLLSILYFSSCVTEWVKEQMYSCLLEKVTTAKTLQNEHSAVQAQYNICISCSKCSGFLEV